VWLGFWYSDRFSKEAGAVNVKPVFGVPYYESGSDKFGFTLKRRGFHDFSRRSGQLPGSGLQHPRLGRPYFPCEHQGLVRVAVFVVESCRLEHRGREIDRLCLLSSLFPRRLWRAPWPLLGRNPVTLRSLVFLTFLLELGRSVPPAS